MRTFCHNCEFNQIAQTLRAAFGETNNPEIRAAVATIVEHVSKICGKCKRTDQDDIHIARSVHPRTDLMDQSKARLSVRTAPIPGVDDKTADVFRRTLYEFFDLEPLQLLLLQHIMQGRTLTTFGDVLAKVASRIMNYRGSEKSKACAMAKAIRAKLPVLEPIIHEKRKAFDTLEEQAPTGDLFEFAGISLKSDEFTRKTPK